MEDAPLVLVLFHHVFLLHVQALGTGPVSYTCMTGTSLWGVDTLCFVIMRPYYF